MKRVAICIVLALAACGDVIPAGEPLPFRARLAVADNPREFTVTAPVTQGGVEAVRESVRFEATAHCLLEFGGSDVAWQTGAGGDWAFTQSGDTLSFNGRCKAR